MWVFAHDVHQIGNAVSQNAGLARTSAGDDADVLAGGLDGPKLRFV